VWFGEQFPRGIHHEVSYNSAAGCAVGIVMAPTRFANDVTRFIRVAAASSGGDLAAALAHATLVTAQGGNERDPEVALTSERAWVAWQSFSRAHPRGEVMAAQLRCGP